MADFYASQQVGVADGTQIPAGRADGRQVGAKESILLATKVAGQAWANGDRIYLGKLRRGEMLVGVALCTDTSFGTTTMSIGPAGTANKYVDAKTLTTTNVPTALGPNAAALAAGPLAADEDIWCTLGVGGVAGAVVATFQLRIASVK